MSNSQSSRTMQLLIALGPAIVAGVFSYLVAVTQARGTTEERTNVTYDTLTEAVDLLEQNVSVNREDLEKLQEYLERLQAEVARVARGGQPTTALPKFTLSEQKPRVLLPEDLNTAILQQKRPNRP